jgi:hypothetical protein
VAGAAGHSVEQRPTSRRRWCLRSGMSRRPGSQRAPISTQRSGDPVSPDVMLRIDVSVSAKSRRNRCRRLRPQHARGPGDVGRAWRGARRGDRCGPSAGRQMAFVLDEGGQIPITAGTAAVSRRNPRFVIQPRYRLPILAISARTARMHCDRIRSKLGVDKRRPIPAPYGSRTGRDPLLASAECRPSEAG